MGHHVGKIRKLVSWPISYDHYLYTSPGKKASWQLVPVVMGLKTMQSGQKRRKIGKTNAKSNEKFAV